MTIFNPLRLVLILFLYCLCITSMQAQEICNNLIDDDNDGLIDVFDPDCLCDTIIGGFEYVPNGTFDNKNDCCTMLSDVNNCLEDWEILQGTPDLYDPNCLSESEIQSTEDLFGFEFESTFINFGVAGSFSETFGTCLLGTLEAGEMYIFEAMYSQTDIFMPDMEVSANISIYGYENCSDLENHNYGASPCDSSPSPIELASFFTNSFDNNEWLDLSIAFSPSVDVEAIFIMVNCNNSNSSNQGIFISMDNLSIKENQTASYDDSISVNGNVCEFSFLLEVPENNLYEYQWYFEGNPIIGSIGSSIELNGQDPFIEGLYTIAVYHPDGCVFYDDFQLVIPTIDQEEFYTICEGDSVFVVGQYWTEAGDYTINYLDTISPCQILLEFHIDLYEHHEFLTIDTICSNEDYLFQGNIYNTEGIYFDSLQTVQGCDSVYILQLSTIDAINQLTEISTCFADPYFWEGEFYNESGTYSSEFITQSGCDSILTLILTIEEIITGDTTFIELQEGEFYIFNGDTLAMEGIYQDTTTTLDGCDSIFFVNILAINPCVISATVESTDLNCSDASNGSITISPSIPNNNYQVSIDGGENFQSQLIFDQLQSGIYFVVIMDGNSCYTELGTIEIINLDDLSASITKDTTIELGGQVTLTIVQANFDFVNISWESTDQNCNDCETLLVSPNQTTTYYATITDENGCIVLQEVTVSLRESTDIYSPNIFTPNNDGINDNFKIFVSNNKNFEVEQFSIYDRWGNQVHMEEDINLHDLKGWNGMHNSKNVSQGVYAYYLKYQDLSGEQIIKGSLSLVR